MTFDFRCPFFRELLLFHYYSGFPFSNPKKDGLNQAEGTMILQVDLQFQFIHLSFKQVFSRLKTFPLSRFLNSALILSFFDSSKHILRRE